MLHGVSDLENWFLLHLPTFPFIPFSPLSIHSLPLWHKKSNNTALQVNTNCTQQESQNNYTSIVPQESTPSIVDPKPYFHRSIKFNHHLH